MVQSNDLLSKVGLTESDFAGAIEVFESPVTHRIVVVAKNALGVVEPLRRLAPKNLFSVSQPGDGQTMYFFEPIERLN